MSSRRQEGSVEQVGLSFQPGEKEWQMLKGVYNGWSDLTAAELDITYPVQIIKQSVISSYDFIDHISESLKILDMCTTPPAWLT